MIFNASSKLSLKEILLVVLLPPNIISKPLEKSSTIILSQLIEPIFVIFCSFKFKPSLANIGPDNVVVTPDEPNDVNPVIVVILFWVAVLIVPSIFATNVPVVPENVSELFVADVTIINLLIFISYPMNPILDWSS